MYEVHYTFILRLHTTHNCPLPQLRKGEDEKCQYLCAVEFITSIESKQERAKFVIPVKHITLHIAQYITGQPPISLGASWSQKDSKSSDSPHLQHSMVLSGFVWGFLEFPLSLFSGCSGQAK